MIPRDRVVEILDSLAKKSRANEVNWQPSMANEYTYVVNFTNSYLSIMKSPVDESNASPLAGLGDLYEVRIYRSIDNSDTLVARYVFKVMDPALGMVSSLYEQASRIATGWDQVLDEIQEAVTHPGPIGLEV